MDKGRTGASRGAGQLLSEEITLENDDVDEISWEYVRRGWSDGLPVVPPTRSRVARMVANVDDPSRVIGVVSPRRGKATIESIAINSVMAGCKPEFLPIVVAAVEAICQQSFNLHSVQVTTHPASPLVIVNGPIRKTVGMNYGSNCLGPGTLANATIGRALRLVMQNIGGGRPGEDDRSTHGQPGKFSYCTAENEEANPWQPLHVDRGFDLADSTVTVIGGEAPHNINDHVGTSAAHILTTCADSMCTLGTNNPFSTKKTEMWLILSPEHASTIAEDGWTKDDVRRFLYERARLPVRRLKVGGLWGMHSWPTWFAGVDDDDRLPIVSTPDNFAIVVAGGDGKHSMCVPTTGSTRSVTVRIPAHL